MTSQSLPSATEKVALSAPPGSVSVNVFDSGAGDASARQWQDQLDQLLDERRNERGAGNTQSTDSGTEAATQSQARPDRSNELRI